MLGFFLAHFLSILLVSILIRYAYHLGLVDVPDERKRHSGVIPRVGGLAIAIGAMVPPILWVAQETWLFGFLAGSGLIVLFGVLDDRYNLDFRVKLMGQAVASTLAVNSGICLYHLPLFGLDAIPDGPALVITVIFILAVTNAFNLLDGLDGLAAGCAILSLAGIGLLAFSAGGGSDITLMSLATIGAAFGFLRYNTFPASVFMGDAGSQFLGFSIAALSIMLIEHTQNALSPAVILPLLGLPILDTCMVIMLRIKRGRSLFSADRNHIHHKLLSVGLKHYQAVAAIYAVQAFIVGTAFVFRFESDILVLSVYSIICLACIVGYLVYRKHAQRNMAASSGIQQWQTPFVPSAAWQNRLRSIAEKYLEWSTAGYLIVGAISATSIPLDASVLASVLAVLVVSCASIWKIRALSVVRLAAYLTVPYVSYVSLLEPDSWWLQSPEFNVWIASVVVAIAVVISLAPRERFQLSTLDLLFVIVVVGALWIPIPVSDRDVISQLLIRSVVFLYACEVLLGMRERPFGPVGMAVSLSLMIFGAHILRV